MKLENVRFIHDRAETFGQKQEHREAYDIVTARAVARMSVLSELCLPLVKIGGTFIAMKGSSGKEELDTGEKAISLLGGKLEETHSFSLPLEESERNIILIKKRNQHRKNIHVSQEHLIKALLSRVTFSY